ncbi:hypothetical protein PAPYR_10577 [Paratrimastix pyriformis]|uniref:TmcB/TmcC TPR repeats domain-containing protein n=1 Tax=Paratrimastix pyriformis TaxID=342808 RepID=A0ABQ8U7H7_9EUKA|nr:hypothetical protein PAPYR_10577 [Paratrimastix pyriformis]
MFPSCVVWAHPRLAHLLDCLVPGPTRLLPVMNARDDLLSRIERGIFSTFYVMRHDSPMPRLKAFFFVIQTLQLFFLVVTIPVSFLSSQWFSIPVEILTFSFAHSLTALYVSFSICAFVIALFVACALFVGLLFQKEDSAVLWPLRFLRGCTVLISWILFVPMLGAFVDILDCRYTPDGAVHDLFPTMACWGMPHVIPSAFAILALVVYLPLAVGVALFHSRGRMDLFVMFCKGLLVVAMRLLTRHTELRAVITVACTALMCALCLLALPYHKRFANVLYTCLYWIGFLAALETTLLWFAFPQHAASWVPFVVLLGAGAVTTPLVAWLTSRRYERSLAVPSGQLARILASGAVLPSVPVTPTAGFTMPGPGRLGELAGRSSEALTPTGGDLSGASMMEPVGQPTALAAPGAPIPLADVQSHTTNAPVLATSLLYLQLTGVPAPEAVVARCWWAPAVEWSTRFLWRGKEAATDPRLVSYAEVIYAKGMARYPDSHGLLLNYAEFLQVPPQPATAPAPPLHRPCTALAPPWPSPCVYRDLMSLPPICPPPRCPRLASLQLFQRNALAAVAAVRRAAALNGAAIDTRFAVYAAERDFETQSSSTEGGARSAHVMSMLTFRRSMRQAQAAHKRAKSHVARVWTFLMRPNHDVRALPPLLDSAVEQANTALEAYSSLLQSFPTSVPLLRGYGSLLQDLYGDIELADNLFAQADQLEEDSKGDGTETGSMHSSVHGAGVASVTGTGPRPGVPSHGRGPQSLGHSRLMGGPAGGSRLSAGDNSIAGGQASVLSFLLNRHAAAAGAEEESATGAEGGGAAVVGRHATRGRLVALLLLGLHVVVAGLLVAAIMVQWTALSATSETGLIIRGTTNCSTLVERTAYWGRQMLQLALESSQPPLDLPTGDMLNGSRVVLQGAALEQFEALQRLYSDGQRLFAIAIESAARGDFTTAWLVRPPTPRSMLPRLSGQHRSASSLAPVIFPLVFGGWMVQTTMNPVLTPVVANGVLISLGMDHMNLWAYLLDYAGKARLLGQITPADLNSDPVLAQLMHVLLNGPLVLGMALVDMSIYTAAATGTNNMTMTSSQPQPRRTSVSCHPQSPLVMLTMLDMMAPLWTSLIGIVFLLGAATISLVALGRVSKERMAVLASFLSLPKDAIRSEYTRLQKKDGDGDGDESDASLTDSAGRHKVHKHGRSPIPKHSGGDTVVAPGSEKTTTLLPATEENEPEAAGAGGETSNGSGGETSGTTRRPLLAAPSPPPTPPLTVAATTRRPADVPGARLSAPSLVALGGDDDSDGALPLVVPDTVVLGPGSAHPNPPLFGQLAQPMPPSVSTRELEPLTSVTGNPDAGAPSATSNSEGDEEEQEQEEQEGGLPTSIAELLAMPMDNPASPKSPHGSAEAANLRHRRRGSRTPKPPSSLKLSATARPTVAELAPCAESKCKEPPTPSAKGASTDTSGSPQAAQSDAAEAPAPIVAKEASAKRAKQLAGVRVLSTGLWVRVLVALVGVSLLVAGSGFVGFSQALRVSVFQSQVAASGFTASSGCWWGLGAGVRTTTAGIATNLVYQLVHNRTLGCAPSPDLSPQRVEAMQQWLTRDPMFASLNTDRALLRQLVQSANANFSASQRLLSYGGQFGALYLPPGLHSLASRDDMWFHLDTCWMYALEECVPGRMAHWPVNSTLSNLVSRPAVGRMVSYDEHTYDLFNKDFEFIDTAFTWDLNDGLDRITMLYRVAFENDLASQRDLEMCSSVFLFRVNLVKGELTKTALMRALLPSSAFDSLGKTAWKSVQAMNVKAVDELHATLLELINTAREAVALMKPHQEIVEAYEALLMSLRQSFQEEERLMTKFNAPHAKSHRRDHQRYLKLVRTHPSPSAISPFAPHTWAHATAATTPSVPVGGVWMLLWGRGQYEAPLEALQSDGPEALEQLRTVLGDSSLALVHGAQMDAPLGRFLNRRGLY